MYVYLLLLRLLHILTGVFWAGTAMLMVFYVFPAVKRAGPEGGKIMQAITGTRKFPHVIVVIAAITVLTGFQLMWHLSNGFTLSWFESKYGMSLAVGGAAAFIAFLQAWLINLPAIKKMQRIGAEAARKGGLPSDDDKTTMLRLRDRIMLSTQFIAFWLIIAVITMACARYV